MPVSLMEDRPPYIEFKVMTEEDRAESIATGSYKTRDVDYVSIIPSGDRHLRVDRKVDEWLEQVAQKVKAGTGNAQHLDYFRSAYKIWKETQEVPLSGTPIKQWPALSPSQVTNILSANIRTVEDLACANEDTMGRIGMGGRALKEKAIAWLGAASNTGKIAEENAAMKVQLTQLMSDMDDLRTSNKHLMNQLGMIDKSPKRGRPAVKDVDDTVDMRLS
jgi:hypothetical protein